MSFDKDECADWKMIHEHGKMLDDKLEELNVKIRESVHTKMYDRQ